MAEQPHDNEQQHTDLVTGGAPLPLTSDDPGRSAAHIAARPLKLTRLAAVLLFSAGLLFW